MRFTRAMTGSPEFCYDENGIEPWKFQGSIQTSRSVRRTLRGTVELAYAQWLRTKNTPELSTRLRTDDRMRGRRNHRADLVAELVAAVELLVPQG